MKLDKRELIYPAIYKHFKGKDYATMGISKPVNAIRMRNEAVDPIMSICMYAEYTESEDIITVFNLDGEWVHLEEQCDKTIVLYKSLYDNHGVYARGVNMFLSEVDKEKYPDVAQEYRFELVRY